MGDDGGEGARVAGVVNGEEGAGDDDDDGTELPGGVEFGRRRMTEGSVQQGSVSTLWKQGMWFGLSLELSRRPALPHTRSRLHPQRTLSRVARESSLFQSNASPIQASLRKPGSEEARLTDGDTRASGRGAGPAARRRLGRDEPGRCRVDGQERLEEPRRYCSRCWTTHGCVEVQSVDGRGEEVRSQAANRKRAIDRNRPRALQTPTTHWTNSNRRPG